MFPFEVFRLAVVAVLAYCASMFWAWWRAERLRSVPGSKEALPCTAGFFTGAAFLWIWSAHYRRLSDRSLTIAVHLARVFFVVAMALWAMSIFLGPKVVFPVISDVKNGRIRRFALEIDSDVSFSGPVFATTFRF
jgi:hypothetical protein